MRKCAAALALVVSIAACSGGSDDIAVETPTAIVTSTSTSPSTSTTTPEPSTTTTTEPSTTAPPTTPPTTESPPVTDPPTSSAPVPPTLDPLTDLAASVGRDAQSGEEAFFKALSDPMAPEADVLLYRYYGGAALQVALSALEQFRADNWIVVANPDVPATMNIQGVPELLVDVDPPTVRADTCRIDSSIVMAPLKDADIRFAVDDNVYRKTAISNFILVDGFWQLQGGTNTGSSEGDLTCE